MTDDLSLELLVVVALELVVVTVVDAVFALAVVVTDGVTLLCVAMETVEASHALWYVLKGNKSGTQTRPLTFV